jgi:radical SAM protein with 4Fe4S-binding SPASM domain
MFDKLFMYSRRALPFGVKKAFAALRDRFNGIFSAIIIETSSECNRRCFYCPNSVYERSLPQNSKKLENGVFRKIVDELALSGWFGQIQFNLYNEPLMDERLADLVGYARLRLPSSSIIVYTNGDFLTVEKYKDLSARGVTDFIVTSHDGSGRDNISRISEFRKISGCKGVRLIYRKLDLFHGRGGIINVSAADKKEKRCLWGHYIMIINHDAEAVLCCEDYHNTVKLGNVRKESLVGIWNKPAYKQLRKELKAGVFRHSICKRCCSGSFDTNNKGSGAQ